MTHWPWYNNYNRDGHDRGPLGGLTNLIETGDGSNPIVCRHSYQHTMAKNEINDNTHYAEAVDAIRQSPQKSSGEPNAVKNRSIERRCKE